MYEQDNPLKTVELSTEQNYNMIDGLRVRIKRENSRKLSPIG